MALTTSPTFSVAQIAFTFIALNICVYSLLLLHPSSFLYHGHVSHTSRDPDTNNQQPLPSHGEHPASLMPSPSKDGVLDIASSSTMTSTIVVPAATNSKASSEESTWKFDPVRDSKAWGLTSDQCDSAFPGLFTEIDRAVAYRELVGHVTVEEVEISGEKDVETGGVVRCLIMDQQLYIIEAHISGSDHPRMRALALLHAINRAIITSPERIPDMEFSFMANDLADSHGRRAIWALTRLAEEQEKWVMSDFGYWAWSRELLGGYEEVRREIAAIEMPFEEKIPKVIWRGDKKNNLNRLLLIKNSEGKDWADVQNVDWRDARHVSGFDAAKAITVPEHCQYQFVIQTEGWSYSGRGKYLQNCNSVVIIPKRKWIEPQHALLVSSGPTQNFVEIEEDYSDLESKMKELLADPEKAKKIAQNGLDMFRDRHLTPAAQVCYWRKMLQGWASVSFTPQRWVKEEGDRIGKRRGVDFETYV